MKLAYCRIETQQGPKLYIVWFGVLVTYKWVMLYPDHLTEPKRVHHLYLYVLVWRLHLCWHTQFG